MTTAQILLLLLTVGAAPPAAARREIKCAEHNCAITLPASADWQDWTATARTHAPHAVLSAINTGTSSNLTVSVRRSKRPPLAPAELRQFEAGYIRSSERTGGGKLSKTYGRWTSAAGLRAYEFGLVGDSKVGRISNSVRLLWADDKLYVMTWFVARGDAEKDPDCLRLANSFRFLTPPAKTAPPPPPGPDHVAEGEKWGELAMYVGLAFVLVFVCVRWVVRLFKKKSKPGSTTP